MHTIYNFQQGIRMRMSSSNYCNYVILLWCGLPENCHRLIRKTLEILFMGKHKPNSGMGTVQWPKPHTGTILPGFHVLKNNFTHPLQLKLIPQSWYELRFMRLSTVVQTTMPGVVTSMRSNLCCLVVVCCANCWYRIISRSI